MWKRKLLKKYREIIKSKIFVRFSLFTLLLLGIYSGLYVYIEKENSQFVSPVSVSSNEYAKIALRESLPSSSLSGVEKLLLQNSISYNEVSTSDSAILIRLKEGEEIVMTSKKSITSQISSLQFILSRLTIEGKKFSHLDFRFERPIIVLK